MASFCPNVLKKHSLKFAYLIDFLTQDIGYKDIRAKEGHMVKPSEFWSENNIFTLLYYQVEP